jgi:DNA repair protein RadC
VATRLAPIDRPRERMLLFGPAALSDTELVALLLGGGHAVERGSALLEGIGGLRGLSRATPRELSGQPGIGGAGASALAAAVELTRRISCLAIPWSDPLRNPAEVAEFMRARLRGEEREHFVVLGLDARQRVRLIRTVAIGSLSQVEVHPREVFRPLVRAAMHACVLVHNHPSGQAEPSDADLELTHRMVEVGRLVGVPVLDHVIVTDAESISLAGLGLVKS